MLKGFLQTSAVIRTFCFALSSLECIGVEPAVATSPSTLCALFHEFVCTPDGGESWGCQPDFPPACDNVEVPCSSFICRTGCQNTFLACDNPGNKFEHPECQEASFFPKEKKDSKEIIQHRVWR